MSFKDIYSEANNELHGDERILLRLLSGNTKKKAFRISYLMPVAAAAVIAIVITAMPHDRGNENLRVAKVVSEPHKEIAEKVPDVVAPQEKIKNENDVLKEALVYEYTAPTKADVYEAIPEVALASNSRELHVNLVEQLAGAEPMSASDARMIHDTKELSAEEYAEYIGKNISADSLVPDDLSFDEPMPVMAQVDGESGEVLSEQGVYIAHTEDYGRFAEITVSRTKEIGIDGEYEQSDILGNQVTVLSDGTDFNASFALDDVRYLIRTGGLSEEELLNLLKSLNGGNNYEKENFDGSNGGNTGVVIDSGSISGGEEP